MSEYTNVVNLFIRTIKNLKEGTVDISRDPLEKIVIKKCGNDLAYVDDRKTAKEEYGFDFWRGLSSEQLKSLGIGIKQQYSRSQQFPDFVFRTAEYKS